jgi:cytidylate kinase
MTETRSTSTGTSGKDTREVIAIDGPVASGKTVVGRELAKRLGWEMLDTGIMYRALTWHALQAGSDLSDHVALTEMAGQVRIDVDKPTPGSIETSSISIDGVNVTAHLRDPEVEASVSIVAAVPGVREHMVAEQRRLASRGRLVMVGRDIGTVVVPNAAIKVYLTASPETRAKRRASEMRTTGRDVSDDQVQDEIIRRDGRDANRDASPLRAADGAIQLDTTNLDRDAVVEAVVELVRRRVPGVWS